MFQWSLLGNVLHVKGISQTILGIINVKKEVFLGLAGSAKEGQSLLVLLENNFPFASL